MGKIIVVLLGVGVTFLLVFLIVNPVMSVALIVVSVPFITAAVMAKILAGKQAKELRENTVVFQNEKEEMLKEIKKKEADQKRHFKQLENFGKELASAKSKDQLLRLIVDTFMELTKDMTGESQCFILSRDIGTDDFTYVTGKNFDRNMLRAMEFSSTDEIIKQVIKSKRIHTDNNSEIFGEDTQIKYFLKEDRPPHLARLSALAMIPLILEDRVWGIIVVFCGESAALRLKREEEFILLLVSEAAIALGSAIHRGLASVDRLTQLYNRTFLQKRMKEELEFCNRQNIPLSFLIIDIDHFKEINDTYGHPEGDMVLKKIAQILNNSVRLTDICARYGGEEFVVVLPGFEETKGGKFSIAERLRANVENAEFIMLGNKLVKITISVGVAVRHSPADNDLGMEDLLQKADAMLYEAKRAGRNRVYYAE
ncbi:MAG: sensor domain-containing diguanylate cyclase [PVC group bacterium]|nr:sensor domain-containing diguanylate cyclase [PVC group bacterium]